MRKLPSYYQFKITAIKSEYSDNILYSLTDLNNEELPSHRQRLTKGQWRKASKYLTRELVPFAGYTYQLKPEYNYIGFTTTII